MAYISFEQILELPQFKKATVLGGMKQDAHVIKCGHVIELPDVEKWIDYGELLFMTGVGLRDVEADLLRVIEGIHARGAAGLVIEVGPYITDVPESVVRLSDKLQVPLITLPFDIRVNDIMTSIYMMYYEVLLGNESVEAVLKKILYYDYDDSIVESALHLGYDPEQLYRAAVIQPDQVSDQYNNAEMAYTINNYFARSLPPEQKHFFLPEGNSYMVMLPVRCEKSKEKLLALMNSLQEKIMSQYKGLTVSVGVGDKFQKLREFRQSTMEAKNAMKLLRACRRENCVRFYEDIGIYRLFFNMENKDEMMEMLNCYLGDLIRYDEKNGTCMTETLEVYMDNSRNIGASAQQLFIHRNTLKYRVNKAQSILHVNFDDANDCFNIRLAYKIKRFLYDIRILE